MHETIGCPFCFSSFVATGDTFFRLEQYQQCQNWCPPRQHPLPPAIITSPPLCFPSISIVYASLVLLGLYSIFRHASLLHVTLLLSFCVIFLHLGSGLFSPMRRTVEAMRTRVYYVGLGRAGVSGSVGHNGKKKVSTLILFAPVPDSNM